MIDLNTSPRPRRIQFAMPPVTLVVKLFSLKYRLGSQRVGISVLSHLPLPMLPPGERLSKAFPVPRQITVTLFGIAATLGGIEEFAASSADRLNWMLVGGESCSGKHQLLMGSSSRLVIRMRAMS